MKLPVLRPVAPFTAATLAPVPLLVLGGTFGGVFVLAALLYMTALRLGLDRFVAPAGPGAAPGAEFPAHERLSVTLAALHFPLLALGVAAVAGDTGLGFWEGLAALLAFGMFFGQVSNSNAHELIHRTDRRLFRLGKWVLISLLYGHHVTAHLRIHHRFVATPEDPNSAALGEGFYAFARRAWLGSFVAGWEIERSIAAIKGRALRFWEHPYAEYVGGGAAFALVFQLAFGVSALIAFLLLCAYAQLQLLLSDYVQHYGLRRRRIDTDTYEPVAPWHSWNAPHWFSSGLMLNASRHSDHHTHPGRPYPELALPESREGPRLPHSLPTMGAIALIPPLWRRMMDRRAAGWQARIDAGEIAKSPPVPPTSVSHAETADTEAEETPDAIEATPGVHGRGGLRAWRAGAGQRARGETPDGDATSDGGGDPPDEVRAPTADAESADLTDTAPLGADGKASPEFLRKLREADPAMLASEAQARKARPRRPKSVRTPELWSDPAAVAEPEETPDEETEAEGAARARFIRSSALFQPESGPRDEDEAVEAVRRAAEARDRAPKPGRDKESERLAIDAAIARIAEKRSKSGAWRRLPPLEPASEPVEISLKDQMTHMRASVGLAARALAALLRGSPADPPEEADPSDPWAVPDRRTAEAAQRAR